MKLKIFLFLTTCLIFDNQYNCVNAKPLIGVNVRRVNQGEWGFTVSFRRAAVPGHAEYGHTVTGTLITRKDVLTASHLLRSFQLYQLVVLVGSVDLRAATPFYPVWWTSYLQWYNARNPQIVQRSYDICIVRILNEVPHHIVPAVILPIEGSALYGQQIELASWGHTYTGNFTRFLEAGTLTVMPVPICEQRIIELNGVECHVTPNIMCSTADPYIIATHGSSGAPVLYQGHLIGLHLGVSPVPTQYTYNTQSVNLHLNLFHFQDYINSLLSIP